MNESTNLAALDRTDLKILRLLQADGRLGNAEIAKRVNTSAATCHRRIQRLFAEGFIGSVRALIALFRTFHPVIVAILFVKAVGFGALAGMLALIVASLSFLSKLVAEAVEEMSMQQVEAVRATGAPFLSLVIMGVLPQVMPRFIGFSAYQLDSNLRNSALVGLVGGGGIGATLFTAFQRFDYDFVLTIVLAIIAVVMVGEVLSGFMRRLFQ